MTKCNQVLENGRSIIEEWRNPPNLFEGILKSDELYEERAVDVVIDDKSQHFAVQKDTSLNDFNDRKEVTVSEKNNGTVRSIPIKNYRASIAHNIGTLRRSEAPQLQFESSVSEPERNFRITVRPNSTTMSDNISPGRKSQNQTTRICNSKYLESVDGPRKHCGCCDFHQGRKPARHQGNSKLKADKRLMKKEPNLLRCEEPRDCHDIDEFFHRSYSQRLQVHRCSKKSEHSRPKSSRDNVEDVTRKLERTDLQHSNVGQKISVYEQNARRIARDLESKCQLNMDTKNHRAIGVPLVGMHNACGLPVLASWHEHELLEPMQIRGRRVVGTLGPIIRGPRIQSDVRRRTHPKRRAPQPHRNTQTKHFTTNSNNTESNQNKSTIKSLASLEMCDSKSRRRKARRPSFRSTKVGSYSSRTWKNLSIGSVSKRPVKFASSKRRTLYARDDGEDAIQVLKNLCLNPLARTKGSAEMIW